MKTRLQSTLEILSNYYHVTYCEGDTEAVAMIDEWIEQQRLRGKKIALIQGKGKDHPDKDLFRSAAGRLFGNGKGYEWIVIPDGHLRKNLLWELRILAKSGYTKVLVHEPKRVCTVMDNLAYIMPSIVTCFLI